MRLCWCGVASGMRPGSGSIAMPSCSAAASTYWRLQTASKCLQRTLCVMTGALLWWFNELLKFILKQQCWDRDAYHASKNLPVISACRRITAVPPEHVGGINHCLAVCDRNTELSKVAEDSNALIMRFSSQAQVPC